MVVLALETVTRAGSLAIWQDGAVTVHRGDPARSHAERLPGDVLELLAARRLGPEDVTLYTVVVGPGSFTGLRVGIAAVQGLAMAGGTRALGVSTLDAVMTAWSLEHDESAQIVACVDGQRGEVFLAARDAAASAPLDAWPMLIEPCVVRPEEAVAAILAATDDSRPLVVVGDGVVRHEEIFRRRLPRAVQGDAPRPLAEAAAILATARADLAGPPHALRAVYLRRPDVEIARERALAARAAAPPGWTIRRAATSADFAAVEVLQQKTFTNPWNAESIRWELEHTDVARLYLVQDEEGRTIAYCACWLVFDELHINSLAVDPECRRRGVARYLLRHVLGEATAGGARSATLEVRASNDPARQLYEGLAFKVEAVRRDYYREPREDALILWNRQLA